MTEPSPCKDKKVRKPRLSAASLACAALALTAQGAAAAQTPPGEAAAPTTIASRLASGGRYVIVTRRDLLQVFLRTDDAIKHEVQREVLGNTLWLAPQAIMVGVEEGVVTLTGRLERRSDITIAVNTTRRVDGVVAVVDQLSYRIDDTHMRPVEQAALHGVADDWMRRL